MKCVRLSASHNQNTSGGERVVGSFYRVVAVSRYKVKKLVVSVSVEEKAVLRRFGVKSVTHAEIFSNVFGNYRGWHILLSNLNFLYQLCHIIAKKSILFCKLG